MCLNNPFLNHGFKLPDQSNISACFNLSSDQFFLNDPQSGKGLINCIISSLSL